MFCNDTKLKILSGFKIAKSSRKVLRAAGEKNQYTTSLSSTSRYCLISQAGRKHTVVFNYLLIWHDIYILVCVFHNLNFLSHRKK